MERHPRGGFPRKIQDRSDRLIHLIRFVRTLVPLLILGVVGCVLGCSGEQGGRGGQGVTPPDKEASKKIAEEMKNAQQEKMKALGSQRR
jgi:hypothetical protein